MDDKRKRELEQRIARLQKAMQIASAQLAAMKAAR